MNKYIILILFLFSATHVYAHEVGKETGLPIPRFVTLKSNKSNLRSGPGIKYSINWIYLRKGYPLEVIAEFENWRKLRDIDGTEGWINENLVVGKRNVIVKNNKFVIPPTYQLKSQEMVLLKFPDEHAIPLVRLELGVIAKIKRCQEQWCELIAEKYSGWIKKSNLWGVYPHDIINK